MSPCTPARRRPSTLGGLAQVPLLEFMRDHILAYADNDDKEIRQAAVLACCKASA